MSVLKKYFNRALNQASPVKSDVSRVVNYDADGNEYVTYVDVDYPSIQASNGSVVDWSLNSLMKAGINPDFPIHTGNPTRLEGVSTIEAASRELDSIMAETSEISQTSEISAE